MDIDRTASSTLIRTKLNIPRIDDDVILRQPLLAKLDSGLPKRLTLIAAPTGYGKTTLAVSWLRRSALPVAWLSLEPTDNDLTLFCRYLVAAIRSMQPDAAANTLTYLEAPYPPSARQLEANLINDLSELAASSTDARIPSLILALDDYHLVHDRAIHTLMHNLILHLAGQVHVLLISRQDPLLLPINRLRAQNDLTEIRQGDLRFTAAETRSSLARMLHANVSEDVAAGLAHRLEGWPTGIRLTSLALASDERPADLLARSVRADGYITDFLMDEVLARQAPASQRFLLETSILDRLCDDLCATVVSPKSTENQAAYEPLAALMRSDLFLIALDDRRNWFRYHHFFQEMLVQHLQASRTADEIASLHRRAAGWYARNGHIEEAIDHCLLAGDDDGAAELIDVHSRNPLNGIERTTHERWLSRLPAAWHHPRLLLAQLWLLYRQWHLSALAHILEQLPDAEIASDGAADTRAIQGHLAMFRSIVLLFIRHDANAANESATCALKNLPAEAADALAVALGFRALARQQLGDGPQAVNSLQKALCDVSDKRPSRQQILLGLAVFHRAAADMHAMNDAVRQFERDENGELSTGAAWLDGMVQYEWNNLDGAETRFHRVSKGRGRTNFAAAYSSILGLARIALARRALTQAAKYLEDARTEAFAINSLDMIPVAMAIGAELSQQQGEVEQALRWARSFEPDSIVEPIVWLDAPSTIWGRILAAHGRDAEREDALSFFEQQLASEVFHHIVHRRVQMQICCALLRLSLDRPIEAQVWLRQSIELATPGALIRSFVDGGVALISPLASLRSEGLAPLYIGRMLDAFDAGRQFDVSINANGNLPPEITSAVAPVKLTRREIEILDLIQSGKTNSEIAEWLVISEHTVKRHATNIYRKLDVRNRTQAIRVAQDQGILSHTASRTTQSVKNR